MKIPVCIIVLFFAGALQLSGQRAMTLSQYMHNRFAVNSSFAGSRDALSLFGSFRQQWAGMPESPRLHYFTGHTPLKDQRMALGLQMFNETLAIKNNFGASLSYTYRVRVTPYTWMAFSASGGVSQYAINWNNVTLEDSGDEIFGGNEASSGPQAGFGWSIYNSRSFGGLSIPEFFYHDINNMTGTSLDFSKIDYLVTGGHLFDVAPEWKVQPSFLLKINQNTGSWGDISSTVIYKESIWGGLTYRTRDEMIIHTGWQALPQLRIAYSYDYSLGDIGSFNHGSHEISLQYDFGYQINTPSPKFF
ncbi:MAG: PorP/SprF family type IX secretion system membrane protein [Marinilabiliaceae bacterium]